MLLRNTIFLSILLSLVISTNHVYGCEDPLKIIRSGTTNIDGQFSKKILDHAGCEIDIIWTNEFVPLERRLALLKEGQIDMIIAVNKRPEREIIGNFSLPFEQEMIRLWARTSDAEKYSGLNLQQLIAQGLTIIGPSKGWFGPEFEQLREQQSAQLLLYSEVGHGIFLLHRKRGDVFLGSEDFDEFFAERYKGKTSLLPQIIHTDYFHFMFSKDNVSETDIQQINRSIQLLTQ